MAQESNFTGWHLFLQVTQNFKVSPKEVALMITAYLGHFKSKWDRQKLKRYVSEMVFLYVQNARWFTLEYLGMPNEFRRWWFLQNHDVTLHSLEIYRCDLCMYEQVSICDM